MPICGNCGKESKNKRMCPFCYTAYAASGNTARKSASFQAAKGKTTAPAGAAMNLPSWVTWGVPMLIIAALVWRFVINADPSIPVGVVAKEMVSTPLTDVQAAAIVKRMKETAEVVTKGTDIVVTIPSKMWPSRRVGQLAIAQEYMHAVEKVEGVKRSILFYDPDGVMYARTDEGGIVMLK
jgi:hypothetical protein